MCKLNVMVATGPGGQLGAMQCDCHCCRQQATGTISIHSVCKHLLQDLEDARGSLARLKDCDHWVLLGSVVMLVTVYFPRTGVVVVIWP